jgi:hypothetical protein
MECTECGGDGAEPVRIEYVEATTERLSLCSSCREEFEDGDLVTDVTVVSTREDSG